jgi:CRP-like cAMP-binding protein
MSRVVVKVGGETVATLGPGQVFGEMALAEDLRRNADVTATELTVMASLMAWDFREALNRYPEFAERVEQLVVSRS